MWHIPLAVNRYKEHTLFQQLVQRQKPQRILSLCAEGGQGKSWLMDSFANYCQQQAVPRGMVRFASDQPIDPLSCMRQLADQLGEAYFTEFHRLDHELHQPSAIQMSSVISLQGANFAEASGVNIKGINIEQAEISYNAPQSPEQKQLILRRLTKTFKQTLSQLAATQPTILLFDTFEHVPSTTATWLQQELLSLIRAATLPNLVVVLAGRPKGTPSNLSQPQEWQGLLIELKRLSPFSPEDVQTYFIERCRLMLEASDIQAYYKICKDEPLMMGAIGQKLQGEIWNDL